MDVTFSTTQCGSGGYCGKTARVATSNGKIVMRCDGGHEWLADFGTLVWLVDDLEKYEALVNGTIASALDDGYIPSCFGNMPTVRHVNIIGTPTDYSSPEAAFISVVNAKIEDAKKMAVQLRLCTKCELFDRCNVISGRREC